RTAAACPARLSERSSGRGVSQVSAVPRRTRVPTELRVESSLLCWRRERLPSGGAAHQVSERASARECALIAASENFLSHKSTKSRNPDVQKRACTAT